MRHHQLDCISIRLVLQLNYYVLPRRKSEPIETAFSGHASAVLTEGDIDQRNTACCLVIVHFISSSSQSKVDEDTRAKTRQTPSSLSRSPCIKSIQAPCPSRWSKLRKGTTPLYTTPATLAFLQSCDTSRCLDESMAIENKKVFFSKTAPFYHYNNNE